jgi:hypothetical protein
MFLGERIPRLVIHEGVQILENYQDTKDMCRDPALHAEMKKRSLLSRRALDLFEALLFLVAGLYEKCCLVY